MYIHIFYICFIISKILTRLLDIVPILLNSVPLPILSYFTSTSISVYKFLSQIKPTARQTDKKFYDEETKNSSNTQNPAKFEHFLKEP